MKRLRIRWNASTVDELFARQGDRFGADHLFVPTPRPLEPGEQVRFELLLSDGSPVLAGTATVAGDRADAAGRPGMMLWFEALDRGHDALLARLKGEVPDGGTLPRGELWAPAEDGPWRDEEDTEPQGRPLGMPGELAAVEPRDGDGSDPFGGGA